MEKDSAYWIKKLSLQKHPEGGYYSENYRSEEVISQKYLPSRFGGNRVFSTSIYFLLENKNFSAFHKIKSDELWHFYQGECVNIYTINENSELVIFKLGADSENGENFQVVIPRNTWFAADLCKADSYALMGCTVAPGFDFADFELAERANLLKIYPQYAEIINKLTIS